MVFKYFENPETLIGFHENEVDCDICGENKTCFNAEAFYGEESINFICPKCLAEGKLLSKNIYTCSGDLEELKKQIKNLNPSISVKEIDDLAKEKTQELENKTPHLATWQDWNWPCADGDYCKFIGYGSKPFYQELAKGISDQEFFRDSFYDKNSFTNDLWEEVPKRRIENFEDSNQNSSVFYVFRSLNSDKILTIWDSN